MNILTEELFVETKGFNDIIDLTPYLQKFLKESQITEGQLLVFVPGSTAGITTIEFEPGLKKDIKEFWETLIPMNRRYHHDDTWHDGNGYAHLRAALVKPDLLIPVKNAQLLLGTWQQVILLDFDNRPRHRKLIVQIMGNRKEN